MSEAHNTLIFLRLDKSPAVDHRLFLIVSLRWVLVSFHSLPQHTQSFVRCASQQEWIEPVLDHQEKQWLFFWTR